ncbi:MAG: hypothetical protein LUQ25_09175, partial [Methanoregulaceae archaeon]|nr:hypothetical protein [Methanoregulaceae archaeon]
MKSYGTMSLKIPRWILPLFFIVLPVLICLCYILLDGKNLVFWDEWGMVPLFEKTMKGTLGWQDIFAQHNEYRIVFPRLAILGLAFMTRFNTVWEMVCSWLILVSILLILFAFYRKYS